MESRFGFLPFRTGYFDLYAYKAFNDGTMSDYIPTDEEIKAALDKLPQV